jgi:hypothetical protein
MTVIQAIKNKRANARWFNRVNDMPVYYRNNKYYVCGWEFDNYLEAKECIEIMRDGIENDIRP